MAYEYWYLKLPAGAKLKGEKDVDTINRELTELVERGWEPVSMESTMPLTFAVFLLRKPKP